MPLTDTTENELLNSLERAKTYTDYAVEILLDEDLDWWANKLEKEVSDVLSAFIDAIKGETE